MLQFSAYDIRVYLRIVLLVLVWKFLSTDFTAISGATDVRLWDLTPAILNKPIDLWKSVMMTSPERIQTVQVVSAVFMLLAAWRMHRGFLLPGLIGYLGIEFAAQQFRGGLFDIDAAVLVLILTAGWPGGLKWIRDGDPTVTGRATRLGWLVAAYIAIAYLLTGLSKPLSDLRWAQNVHLENAYACVHVLYNTRFEGVLDYTARFHERLFGAYPDLGTAFALATCAAESLWPLALFFRGCRLVIPTVMLGMHIGILLSVGIFFFPFPYVAYAILIPWRRMAEPGVVYHTDGPGTRLADRLRRLDWFGRLRFVPTTGPAGGRAVIALEDAAGQYAGADAAFRAALRCPVLTVPAALFVLPGMRSLGRVFLDRVVRVPGSDIRTRPSSTQLAPPAGWRVFVTERLGIPVALAAFLALLPLATKTDSFPLPNYLNFGWSYGPYSEPFTVYRLGYVDPETGELTPVPVNHSGFFDYLLVANSDANIRFFVNHENPEVRAYYLKRVGIIARFIRPHGTNNWLLGPFSCPGHTFHHSDPVPLEYMSDLRVLKGEYHYRVNQGRAEWQDLGRLNDLLRDLEAGKVPDPLGRSAASTGTARDADGPRSAGSAEGSK